MSTTRQLPGFAVTGTSSRQGQLAGFSWSDTTTSGAVSGQLSVTEQASDAFASTGSILVQGSLSLTESISDVFSITGAARSTFLRPNSDITVGAWTPSIGTTLYSVLDEAVADSSDYIETQTISSCEVKLSSAGTPLVKTNHILKYQLLSGSGSITVKLVQGASVIKTWSHSLTGSVQNIISALSEAEAQTITNYADLRVRFET